MNQQFKLEDGSTFDGLTYQDYQKVLTELSSQNGLSQLQIAESAGVGAAMVLRVALGLSASGAALVAIVDDSRAGYIGLAMLRQLCNAGSAVTIYTPGIFSEDSDFGKQLFATFKAGATLLSLQDTTLPELKAAVGSSHAFIFATFGSAFCYSEQEKEICAELNDHQTPVHTIEFPPGVNPETGTATEEAIFAATTIIPGLPLASLSHSPDYVGRMYVCDVSVPIVEYQSRIPALATLFEQQPVKQIFFNQVEQAEESP